MGATQQSLAGHPPRAAEWELWLTATAQDLEGTAHSQQAWEKIKIQI